MRRLNILLFSSILFVAAAVGQTRHDVFVRVGANDSLDATYYVPSLSPPANGFPALLFVHGFGLNKDYDTLNCATYAALGYMTMCYSVRGHGNSTGLSAIMSTQERSDLQLIVSFIRGLPTIDTMRIGISGGSQGGLHGLWAVADRLPVKTISSDVIVPSWASDMLMNGSIRRTLILLLRSPGVRYDSSRSPLWEFVRTDNYDSLLSNFPRDRDVDTSALNHSTIPTLRLLKWQDHYFSATGGIEAFLKYDGLKKLYVGSRGHFSDLIESERVYQNDQVTRWFNYFLRDLPTGILDESLMTYAYSSLPMDTSGYFTWTRVGVSSWPPSGVVPFKFYLSSDSTLRYTPPAVSSDSMVVMNDYRDTNYTFDIGYIEGFKGPIFDAAIPKSTLVFTSQSLPNDIFWIGPAKMKLLVRSDYEQFPIHAQVYEMDSIGTKYFINRINFTARHWSAGSSGSIEAEGIPHAHKFTRGNRIHIELTNIDRTNRIQLGIFPFVLPMFRKGSATISMDAAKASYIELPLIGTPTTVREISNEIPSSSRLYQNFPNPFNPVTHFRFQISDHGIVTLDVLDLLGRKVTTLLNELKPPGEYGVEWDVSDGKLASGVYFYRLTMKPTKVELPATQFTKKMLLVK